MMKFCPRFALVRLVFVLVGPLGMALSQSAADSWSCTEMATPAFGEPYRYFCIYLGSIKEELHPSLTAPLLGAFNCATPNLTSAPPSREDCHSWCALIEAGTNRFCNACGLTESGELAYDCSNLFPDIECPQRDPYGACTDEYIHWLCTPFGLGYSCNPADFSSNTTHRKNPAFSEQIPGAVLQLYCANDIGGKTVQDCVEPICVINDLLNVFEGGAIDQCYSCDVVSLTTASSTEPLFSYDCTNVFPDMECPQRDTNGTCVQLEASRPANPASKEEATSTTSDADDNDGSLSGWILYGISATGFNVVSDMFAYTTRGLFAVVFGALYSFFMTWQMKTGKPIPINQLGRMPGDFFQATATAKALQWSAPSLVMVGALFVADLSHSMADIGLDFVTVQEKGPSEPVLVMSTDKRNKNRPIQTAGDPLFSRTVVTGVGKDIEQIRTQSTLTLSYLSAVTLIARGSSPFVTSAIIPERNIMDMGGVPGFNVFYMADHSPLVRMDAEIPLDCGSIDMVQIEHENVLGDNDFEEPLYSTAFVPNCTLTGLRQSGIYELSSKPSLPPSIIEHAEYLGITPVRDSEDLNIRLRNGTSVFQVFNATPANKRLARDRDDWTKGRQFFGVDGMVVGNTTIDFGTVVLATGGKTDGQYNFGSSVEAQTEYGLVAEITGQCPQRVSRRLSPDNVDCFAIVTVFCDTFPEDHAPFIHEIYAPQTTNSECSLNGVRFIWGRNFVADPELIATMAGIYGMVRPVVWDASDRAFQRHGAMAALFALGTLEEMPSHEDVVRPKVNGVYIFFILLPLFMCILVVAAAIFTRKRYCLPIPQTPWELMVLAKETPMVPRRSSAFEAYPKVDKDLSLFVDALDSDDKNGKDDDEEPSSSSCRVGRRSSEFSKRQSTSISKHAAASAVRSSPTTAMDQSQTSVRSVWI